MVISKNGDVTGNQHIQKISSVRYLECWLSSEWDNKEEKVSASSRLEQHLGKWGVLTSRDLSFLLRWLRCYVFSTLYYGMKGCTLTKAMRNRGEVRDVLLPSPRRLQRGNQYTDFCTNHIYLGWTFDGQMKWTEHIIYNILKVESGK